MRELSQLFYHITSLQTDGIIINYYPPFILPAFFVPREKLCLSRMHSTAGPMLKRVHILKLKIRTARPRKRLKRSKKCKLSHVMHVHLRVSEIFQYVLHAGVKAKTIAQSMGNSEHYLGTLARTRTSTSVSLMSARHPPQVTLPKSRWCLVPLSRIVVSLQYTPRPRQGPV